MQQVTSTSKRAAVGMSDMGERLAAIHTAYPTHFIYALLDRRNPPEPAHLLSADNLVQHESAPVVQTVARPDLARQPRKCPLLVQVVGPEKRTHADLELRDALIDQASQPSGVNSAYMCGWLVSAVPIKRLATQLARTVVVQDDYRGARHTVALFEPHRLALLADTVDSRVINAWLGLIDMWLFTDAAGRLRTIEPDPQQPCKQRTTVTLSATQGAAQSRIPHIRQAIAAAHKLSDALPARPEVAANSAFERADTAGLTTTEDRITYVVNHLVWPSGWQTQPEVSACIAAVARNEARLADQLAALPASVLAALADARHSQVQHKTGTAHA